ncbi:hypothetical protein AAA799D07_00546 [Marine Group I thaumarchaeote SCGC AAA799-D07]|jgi:hypothetical protein|nr:hypothetical protein AAA799D07_00546 [Marine Group I thaumarchaeote SCGC AAA799-D07]
MEGDPTGGMWIYLIFLIIPLARILPRMLRKYRRKATDQEPEPAEKDYAKQFFIKQPEPKPPKYREEYMPEPEPESKPDKKDGWVGKDDFK